MLIFHAVKSKPSGVCEKAQELAIKEALECIVLTNQHPRSLISTTIQLDHNDGSVRCS